MNRGDGEGQMNANASVNQPNGKSDLGSRVRKRMLQVIVQFLVIAAILFIASGRLDWVWAWAYLGVGVGILVINASVLPPELIAERGQIKEDTKGWDRLLAPLLILPTLGTLIVAGLDERFGWSPQLALAIQVIALAFFALAQGLFSWAMASNKFFSGTVRIQEERGHAVASGGPYRYVRHPGYVGYIMSWIATSLALGSLWALIPAGLVMCLMVVRTALEDKTLLEELDGYPDYAAQVRYRLLPGVW
jgi:protein-S-isoprenylcysteine O-methyltransferase Ste14